MDYIDTNDENAPPINRFERSESQKSDDSQAECSSRAPSVEDFTLGKPVSRGAFGKVFLGYKKTCPDKIYAIKVMKKADLINKNVVEQAKAERDAMASTFCPHIVKLFYSFQSKQNIYLIMEYLIGGDVKSLLTVYGFFDEDMAVLYAAEITLALEYLHKRGIIHRDIKPDNMLISGTGHIKLSDFGLSKITLKPEQMMTETLLTPEGGTQTRKEQDYRTPGQILSLASSLAFTVPHSAKVKRFRGSGAGSRGSRGLPSHIGRSPSLMGTPRGSLEKVLARERSARQSIINHMTPPVKSLTPTLIDSANRLNSTMSDGSGPRVLKTSTSNREEARKLSANSTGEDDVFKEQSSYHSIDLSSSDKMRLLFSNLKSHKVEVISSPHCESHLKASAKQESITDNTPQLHRTNESLWTSYAARNLRSMRDGSYSEDNDEVDGFLNSPLPQSKNAFIAQARSDLMASPRCSSRTSDKSVGGYGYPSDDEEDLHKHPTLGHRKRRFIQVDSGSAHTGMTGVFNQLNVDGQRAKKRIISVQDKPVDMLVDFTESSEQSGNSSTESEGGSVGKLEEYDASSDELHHHSSTNQPGELMTDSRVSNLSDNMGKADCFQSPLPLAPKLTCDNLTSAQLHTYLNESTDGVSMSGDQPVGRPLTDTSPPARPESELSPDMPGGTHAPKTPGLLHVKELEAPVPTTAQRRARFSVWPLNDSPIRPIPKSLSAVVSMTPDTSFRSRCPNFWTPKTPVCCRKTPYRTPKSVRPGVEIDDDKRILGTPDYLAPELLLQQGHGPGVDWWALGVCLFEFLTGVPPFYDSSPELIFQNILNRDIPWPEDEEALSENATQAINALLTHDAKLRPTAKNLKTLPLFSHLDWSHILDTEPPFVPQPDDDTDTSYFQARNMEQQLKVSAVYP